MYLARRISADYGSRNKLEVRADFDGKPLPIKSEDAYIQEEVAYWRKANAIHKWFVENVQDGQDDCAPSPPFGVHVLETLCRAVLHAISDRDPTELPPQAGFFFGGTDVDEWYWQYLEETAEKLVKIIDEHKQFPEGIRIYYIYQSSW